MLERMSMIDIIKQIEENDFSLLGSSEKGELAAVLLKKIPEITGLIQGAAKDREHKISQKFNKIKEEVVNGTCDSSKIESFIEDLSNQYTFLLSQVGLVENQLIQAEAMRVKLADAAFGVRMATLPIALLINFVTALKETNWATIVWDEKNGTRVDNITEYARLVDIYIEPNMQWSEKITFRMLMGGYLPESEYVQLQKRILLRLEPYNK